MSDHNNTTPSSRTGPLSGILVLEIESMGPGPFAAMMLADMGANVLTIRRPGNSRGGNQVLERGRAGVVELNAKEPVGKRRLIELIGKADVLVEGYRPGVMERLGLGPAECEKLNPGLIYGRVTGWGREGPLVHTAGHDINYIGLSGSLYGMGTKVSGPVPPLNLVGDYGGGGLILAWGIAAALYEREKSGCGQVVDAAMLEGAGVLMSALYGRLSYGGWSSERGCNLLDGSAYYYRCYECKDGGWMSVGPLELPFRKIMFDKLGLADRTAYILQQADDSPEIHKLLENIFASKPRDEWTDIFFGTDACVAPVLRMDEVGEHPQNQACANFQSIGDTVHPVPAPRFSRTQPELNEADPAAMAAWGL